MTKSQDHCDEHCIRPRDHSWGQCEGEFNEKWHLRCPRCAEREITTEQVVFFLDDLADAADDAGYRGRRDTIYQVKYRIQRGEHISD